MPSRRRRTSITAALALSGLAASPALASERTPSPEAAPPETSTVPTGTPDGPGWAFGNPFAEVALAGVSLLSLTAGALPQQSSSWAPAAQRPANATWSGLSDVTGADFGTGLAMLGGVGLELAYYRARGDREPFVRAMRSALVEAEAVALTTGTTMALKALTGRCRPRAYAGGACVGTEYDAFPSGHTSPTAAVAGVRLVHAVRAPGPATARYVSFALAETASVVTGVLRVAAGAHSWDDVVAGWALGHGIGALMALAHPWTPSTPLAPPGSGVPLAEIPGIGGPTELPIPSPRAPTLGGSLAFHF
ncbi:MAG: phosphatase PAP2 family protein [Deltaproteobacteria bacterium]|nr:phosphatase PAP2 family protein [Deltaproteobacteria bacterium]